MVNENPSKGTKINDLVTFTMTFILKIAFSLIHCILPPLAFMLNICDFTFRNRKNGKCYLYIFHNDAYFVTQLPPEFCSGDGEGMDMKLPNKVYNKLKAHSEADHKRSQKLHEKKEHSTSVRV